MSWDPKQFQWNLSTRRFGREFEYFDVLDSTNRWLAENNTHFSLPGSVVIADHQTQGRGRQSRSWMDHAGRSLLCSINLFSIRPIPNPGLLSLLPAIALARVILRHDSSAQVELKWPNDVQLNRRKIAGILAESHSRNGETYYVVGVGVNVSQSRVDFRDAHLPDASSIHAESTWNPSREVLLACMLNEWEGLFERLLAGDSAQIRREWERLGPPHGTTLVRVEAGSKTQGRYEGLGESGQIILLDEHGRRIEFHSGDIFGA